MRDITRLGLILMIISAVAAGSLALTNDATTAKIAAQEVEAKMGALGQVMPGEGVKFSDVTSTVQGNLSAFPDVEEVWVGESAGKKQGLIVVVAPVGYADRIRTMVALDTTGKVLGMKVLSQSETPGLGTKSTDPQWQKQFVGKQAGKNLEVVKQAPTADQIQAITAATISSKAVTSGINQAFGLFKQISGEVLK
ncbi:MAG: RnfABCDGE type electron transport complex subunit G [Bacillota bacterium]